MTRWRLLLTPAQGAADNMALDEALLHRARDSREAVLRIYAWSQPTLSFGRNQTARGSYDPGRMRTAGVSVVRRPTGGRALLHHREVTYSVTAPVQDGDSPRESYARINRLLLDGLRRLGVRAELAEVRERAPVPASSPCFERPSAGELVIAGRKLVGSAQWRDQDALLQHGSILIDDDQPRVVELSSTPLPPPLPAATLRGALGRAPALEEVAEALFIAVRTHADPDATPLVEDDALRCRTMGARARYLDDTWTWRR